MDYSYLKKLGKSEVEIIATLDKKNSNSSAINLGEGLGGQKEWEPKKKLVLNWRIPPDV